MKKSAGIIVILNNEKVLLCHPTNSKIAGTFSFPKGTIEKGESKLKAALREFKEETSITINPKQIEDDEPIHIEYKDKHDKVYKKVYLYKVYIEDISEIGLKNEVIPKKNLQLEEIDWCGFLTKEDASDLIFFRLNEVLNNIL